MFAVRLDRARTLGVVLAVAGAFTLGGSTVAALPRSDTAKPVVVTGLEQAVGPNALPAYVAGTRWLVVNPWDVTPVTSGTSSVGTGFAPGVIMFTFSNPIGTLAVPLNLPLGALAWQIDVYGYRLTSGSLSWALSDLDETTGTYTALPPLTTTGIGLLHAAAPLGGAPLALGHTITLQVDPTDITGGFVGAIVQYTQPLTNVLVPITPVRVFDSRFSSNITPGAPRTINVKDAIDVSTGGVVTPGAIPQGATAISFTLTVTATVGAGYLAVLPGITSSVTASTINWYASGQTLAAGGIVLLGTGAAERKVTLVLGGTPGASTHAILDITGYYVSEG
jgi:hypothetical protein